MSKTHQHSRQSNSQAQLAVKALLADKPVAYHPVLARAVGSVNAAIFLSQLLYWLPYSDDPDGWIWKTRDDISHETALSRTEQENARKVLLKSGVMEEQLRKLPARMHFRINVDRLVELLGSLEPAPSGGTASRKPQVGRPITAAEQPVQLAGNLPTGWSDTHQPVGGKPANLKAGNLPAISENTSETTPERKHHHHPDPASSSSPTKQGSDDDDLLASQLRERGVSTRATNQLVKLYPPELIRSQVAYFDFRVEHHSPQLGKNAAGFLRRSIEENYPVPQGFVDPAVQAEQQRRAEVKAQAEAEQRDLAHREQLAVDAAEHAIPPAERARHRVENLRRMAKIAKRDFSQSEADERYAYFLDLFTRNAETFFAQHPEFAHLRADPQADELPDTSQPTKAKRGRKAKTASPEPRTASENGRAIAEDLSSASGRLWASGASQDTFSSTSTPHFPTNQSASG